MAQGTATITAKSGPGLTNTAIPLSGITAMSIDWARQVIQIYQGAQLTGPCREYDLTGVTTLTISAPATAPVIVVS